MIAAGVVALAALAVALYVALPLLRGTRRAPAPVVDHRVEEAAQRKHAALGAIVELEEEHDLGKLGDADYEALRSAYEAEAVAALRELDAAGRGEEAEIELEIAAIRSRLACPGCGGPRRGTVCPRCGTGSSTETP
jgi:hypothetical protein